MFKLVPFRGADVGPLLTQEINAEWRENYSLPGVLAWLESQRSFTGMIGDKVAVCGGITEYWAGRGHIWTIFNQETKHCFVPIFRGIRRFLVEQIKSDFHRIEVSIPCGFEVGQRRAKMLGFRLETAFAEGYLPGGADASVYVMTRRGH